MNEHKHHCPRCFWGFNSAKDLDQGKCYECAAELAAVRITIPGKKGFHWKYELARDELIVENKPAQPKPVEKKEVVEEKPDYRVRYFPIVEPGPKGELPLMISDGMEIPEVWLIERGESKGDGRMIGNRYRMIFRNALPFGWIYCPGCRKKMFQNQMIRSGGLAQEHMCRHNDCKAIIELLCE